MKDRPRKIGVLTSGGDCAGLNAVLRGVTRSAMTLGWEVYGFEDGFEGLLDPPRFIRLDRASTASAKLRNVSLSLESPRGVTSTRTLPSLVFLIAASCESAPECTSIIPGGFAADISAKSWLTMANTAALSSAFWGNAAEERAANKKIKSVFFIVFFLARRCF